MSFENWALKSLLSPNFVPSDFGFVDGAESDGKEIDMSPLFVYK